ncbi:hypothetical protein DSECCO2_308360 [anaerobic digester metagenome]|jgi:hypothetical protein|uniref:Uncharacterized protein n=1 Tax=Methanobacterium subterraneum TaxID=59277 RepID=A0A2H4VS06_9EURY|nr:hypothetical protein [Methanobacterium subterraneum]AUB60881.1 hypothetical protein BK009_09480 [Methanobacterium subterraneum]
MFQPKILEGCNTLNSFQTVSKVDGFDEWFDFRNSVKDKTVPVVFILELDDGIAIHYLMDHMSYSLSDSAHMTIKKYFMDICKHYDDIGFLKGTNNGYYCYSTWGVIDRVHPDDADKIGLFIYDIVMDIRNWWR